jgi:hypothetical protein
VTLLIIQTGDIVTTFNIVYLACGLVGVFILLYKIPDLRLRWGSPRLWSLTAVGFCSVTAMLLAAPTNITALREMTGVTNIAAPIVYSLMVAYAAAALSLVLFWRFPTADAWRRVQWIITFYTGDIVVINILFAVSSVDVERQVDFVTYYATQPTIAAMLLAFWIPGLIGNAALAHQCWSGSRTAQLGGLRWLARGLLCYAIAVCFPVAYCIISLAAFAADWLGVRSLDPVSTVAPALSALGIFPAVLGVVLPLWGPRRPVARRWVRSWQTFYALRPLHRALRHVHPEAVSVAPGKQLDPHHRVRRQLVELNEFRLGLASYFSSDVAESAARLATEDSLSEREVKVIVEAAQLKCASGAMRRNEKSTLPTITSDAAQSSSAEDGTGIVEEARWWGEVSWAFQKSPVVAKALANPTPTSEAAWD